MAMPTNALAKLLPTDQLAAHESGPSPAAYHSSTSFPPRTTTTPCVCRSAWKAYECAPSSTVASIPSAAGDVVVHPFDTESSTIVGPPSTAEVVGAGARAGRADATGGPVVNADTTT